MIESLLLTTTRVVTYREAGALSAASAFFFERDGRLYLVTSRHVLVDEPSGHFPDRIEFGIHVDPQDLAQIATMSVLLHQEGKGIWHQGSDAGGDVDIAAIELDRSALPATATFECFTEAHLQVRLDEIEVGTSTLIVGFPLGFHDSLHHLPVVRQAAIASSFGLRFQGKGYFMTDARTHRGSSGAPVVMRSAGMAGTLPWKLLGVHSASMDMGNRDLQADESLGLNLAWYADMLLTLTTPEVLAA